MLTTKSCEPTVFGKQTETLTPKIVVIVNISPAYNLLLMQAFQPVHKRQTSCVKNLYSQEVNDVCTLKSLRTRLASVDIPMLACGLAPIASRSVCTCTVVVQ